MKAFTNYVFCILWSSTLFGLILYFIYLVFNIPIWMDVYNDFVLIHQVPTDGSYAGW